MLFWVKNLSICVERNNEENFNWMICVLSGCLVLFNFLFIKVKIMGS